MILEIYVDQHTRKRISAEFKVHENLLENSVSGALRKVGPGTNAIILERKSYDQSEN